MQRHPQPGRACGPLDERQPRGLGRFRAPPRDDHGLDADRRDLAHLRAHDRPRPTRSRRHAPGTSSTRSTHGGALPFCCQCCQAPSTARRAVPGVVEDRHLPRSAAARAAGACGPRASGTRHERSSHRRRSEEPQSSPQSARDSNPGGRPNGSGNVQRRTADRVAESDAAATSGRATLSACGRPSSPLRSCSASRRRSRRWASPPARIRPRAARSRASTQLRGVNFVSHCAFSHRAPDDPIVYPGRPGASHDHTFLGSKSTDANSTNASLRAAASTCKRRGETAAYWVPTLAAGGQPVVPAAASVVLPARHDRRRQAVPVRLPDDRRLGGRDHAAAARR